MYHYNIIATTKLKVKYAENIPNRGVNLTQYNSETQIVETVDKILLKLNDLNHYYLVCSLRFPSKNYCPYTNDYRLPVPRA